MILFLGKGGQDRLENRSPILGIIGGLGPMATAHFLELTVQMTLAGSDQEHLETIIFDRPSTPDRTAYILDHSSPSPLPQLLQSARQLEALGATCLAIPCITAHYFLPGLVQSVSIPVINALEQTARLLQKKGIRTVGILGTSGTVQSGLLQDVLGASHIRCVVPDDARQRGIMSVIYDEVKAGRAPSLDKVTAAAGFLRSQGAECNLLACTELSLVKRDYSLGAGILDILEVLAQACVLHCGKLLRPEYQDLITV